MIGETKEVEIGRTVIYEVDKDGKDTKKIKEEIPGKKFEIMKKGCSASMVIQGLFTLIITKARLELGAEMPVEKMLRLASVAITDDIAERIKEKVIQCVSAPIITQESFEEMDPTFPLDLFAEIYDFHCGTSNKKKEKPE